jgi:predicted DNA-binding transcriptional regulator AlpA
VILDQGKRPKERITYGQPVPPQQFLPEKLPQSQDSTHASLQGTADALDDVSFLRLPEVKAVMGLSKTSLYALIRANSFPAPRPTWAARSRHDEDFLYLTASNATEH